MTNIIYNSVENQIISIRNSKVILDRDVAKLYGVETKRINEAVRRNPNKFPDGYIIKLTKDEFISLQSQFATTISPKTRSLPNAFTEKGLYMLSTILKSDLAEQATINIIETFAKIRELSSSVVQLSDPKIGKQTQKKLSKKINTIISDIIPITNDNEMETDSIETKVKVNLGFLSIETTIKNKKV